jgi:hypothetical protein
MTFEDAQIKKSIAGIVNMRCTQSRNPIGSTLVLDFGPVALPRSPVPGEKPRGERRLTVYSPWRVQSDQEIVFDWNVDGGAGGRLPALVGALENANVRRVETRPPGWDLEVDFDNGLTLVVFGDVEDERDVAWFILDADAAAFSARPRVRPLPG